MGCGRKDNIGGTSHRHEGCVSDVVKTILDIQNQAVDDDCDNCGTSCYLEPLGGLVSPTRRNADTRVFMLLNANGLPFFAFFSTPEGAVLPSVFFRVEDVFDSCATLRVVAPWDEEEPVNLLNDDETGISMGLLSEVISFRKTDTCLTVDLSCFCGVQCVKDVNLHICD
ncbi:CotY/CotZ family spore coat protein [Lysinibacillus telephonicus]|uniref:Spore coat protein CotZ n=1 Tax=Lysinibacillus telephonicus TaxID=1714840 RepID=A0A3S0JMU2_9BACI|nr:CotY/CotZ family spore coat protein [Lysinibacillus telephonicus]RTQ89864.1 spore coat protein CotZ [Lysinibacillus telephonicus]